VDTTLTARAHARQVQGRQIEVLARQQEALEVARVQAAYRHLVQDTDFLTLRQYWIERYLLQPIPLGEGMAAAVGQHNFLVQMLAEMRGAGAVEHLPEEEVR
jgi:hypothetical protein